MKKTKWLSGKRVKTMGLALLLSVMSLAQIHAQNDPALIWSKISGSWAGGFDGTFGAMAVDPTNPNIILIGSSENYGAGIFKSVDGGVTWTAKNSGIAQIVLVGGYQSISKIVISPSNPNVVYFAVATGGGGSIYRSTDEGESWQRVNGQQNFFGVYQLNGDVYDFDVSPTDPNTVYAGVTGQGIMKTSDGGMDWNIVFPAGNNGNGAIDYFNVVRVLPTQPNTVYFSGFTDYLIDVIPGIFWIENLEAVPDTSGVIPFPLRKSTDGGTTWNTLAISSGPLLTDLQFENASGNLYASTTAYKDPLPSILGVVANQGVFMSPDLGNSWQSVNQASFGNLNQFPFASMSANPSSVNKGVFGATGFGGIVVVSTNAGNNWMRLDPCLSSAFIAKTTLAGNKLFALTDLGIFVTDISSLYAPATPEISSISPATLVPSSSAQLITITGSNFLPSGNPNASTLLFTDPNGNTYTRTPVNVTANSLQYNLNVQSAVGVWTVEVLNGNVASAPFTFSVAPINTQLMGISVSGSANVFQNTSGNQYTATAIFSDGSTATVTPAWSLNSGAPASISTLGQLTANSVSANTTITITATYTYNGVSKTANYSVKISPLSNGCGSTVTANLIANGDFESNPSTTGWTLSGGAVVSTFGSLYHSATHYLWLGGDNGTDSAYLQTTISGTATAATLYFWLNINTSEPSSFGSYDTISVVVRDTNGNLLGTISTWSNLNGTTAGSYQFQSLNVLPYVGKTIRIYFVSSCHLSGSQTTNFRIDDVGVIATIPNPVTAVLFGMNGPTSVSQNTTAQYNAIVVNCDNSIQSVIPSWSISSGPATISSSGQLSAGSVNADTAATVTAIYSGARIDYLITILHVAPVFTSLTIGGVNSVYENQLAQFTATELFSDGSGQSVSPTWSVDSSSASISSSGLLTAGTVSANTTVNVYATFTVAGITHTASQQVTVFYVPPPPTLASLNIFGPSSINENSSAQFSAAALFSDGSSQVVNPVWSENVPTAQISSLGLFSSGDVASNTPAVISASYSNGEITCASSNNIAIVHIIPTISFQMSNDQIILSWFTNFDGYSLENTTNLPVTAWTTNSTLPVIVGQQFFVTNPITSGNMFYRLIR